MLGAFRSRPLLATARFRSRKDGVHRGTDLARLFSWVRPNDLIWNYWVNNYLMGKSPPCVRHPRLELRQHEPDGRPAPRFSRDLREEPVRAAGRVANAGITGRPPQSPCRQFRDGCGHRSPDPMERLLPGHTVAGGRKYVRAQSLRAHCKPREPSRQPAGELLDGACARSQSRGLADRSDATNRILVGGMGTLDTRPQRTDAQRPQAGQPRVSGHGAGPWDLYLPQTRLTTQPSSACRWRLALV
jgi:hypothetical protein